MLKEKELTQSRDQVRIPNGQNITLNDVKVALKNEADANGVPIAFASDQIKFGGLIGGSTEDCLVVYHPEHQKDYFNSAVRLKHQGNYAFLTVYDFGTSRLLGNAASAEFTKEKLKATLHGGSVSEAIGAAIGGGLRRLIKGGANKSKIEEEQNWYLMLDDMFDNIFA